LLREGVALLRGHGSEEDLGQALNGLGIGLWVTGELAEARRVFEETAALRRRRGLSLPLALTLGNLASIALREGQ